MQARQKPENARELAGTVGLYCKQETE